MTHLLSNDVLNTTSLPYVHPSNEQRYQVSLDGAQILSFLHVVNMFVQNGVGFLRKMPTGEVRALL